MTTVAALVSGIISVAHGSGFDQRHSHEIKFARVGGREGLTLTLVLLLIALRLAVR